MQAIAVYIAKEVGGIALTEATCFFRRNPATVSIAVKKLRERAIEDPELSRNITKMMSALKKEGN